VTSPRTYSRFFGWSVASVATSARASLPALATHFIASFRPDDYLALYEGHRRPRSGSTKAPKHPVVRILDPLRPSLSIAASLRCLSSRITTRLIPRQILAFTENQAHRDKKTILMTAAAAALFVRKFLRIITFKSNLRSNQICHCRRIIVSVVLANDYKFNKSCFNDGAGKGTFSVSDDKKD